MVSFQYLRYGSVAMREGKASHLYAGAMRRGRSVRTVVGFGLAGAKLSLGQPGFELELGLYVGVENAVLLYSSRIRV